MSDPKDAKCKKPIIDFFLLVSSDISMEYILLKEKNCGNDIMDWRLAFSERVAGYPIISLDVGATILLLIYPQLKMDFQQFIFRVATYVWMNTVISNVCALFDAFTARQPIIKLFQNDVVCFLTLIRIYILL